MMMCSASVLFGEAGILEHFLVFTVHTCYKEKYLD